MKKVYLHYYNSNHRGPGMVVKNLLGGLKEISDVEIVTKPNQANLFGCLQNPFDNFWLPSNTLMGPNLFVLPDENKPICEKFNSFIVPSLWVKDLYLRSPLMVNKNIHVWPVGIDTNFWIEEKNINSIKQDCFIYFKNRSKLELQEIQKSLDKLKINFKVIEYGNYQEQELFDLCQSSRFAILLTDTESQGIAYMNILSTNTPCIVLNKQVWEYSNNNQIKHTATSVPYFDSTCGITLNSIQEFETIVNGFNPNEYEPRKYILLNHTQKMGAEKYINLLLLGSQQ